MLLLTAVTCSAQEARNPDYDYTPGYGTIKWPERRQHLLAGRYTGKIQVQVDRGACPSASADLRLEAIKGSQDSRHYTLTYTCLSGTDPNYRKKTVTLRSTWGIDEIAGSCLILQREPDPTLNPPLYYPLYGFRIHENDSPGAGHGIVLSQDGSDCESGGASEYLDKKLKRLR
ncbi:hypothetical protein [Xanthomonas phaseoli]|uniref:Uncharacterized protein n=1 Tax=Xanthomonas manihotis TaxID=43353 RepID=A0A8I1XNE1_XANMN|nr:hypothetical protein [Xanthomonas phaseoli]KUF24654.1 hypothetical protein AO826_02130 [Xanthomonas phaseoli pv. manihotis]MBO9721703.1 hypothetical protein [Xanthomonas phaseoli pv. manihotis]MBO9756909.1 hypothetical protein [Xanthomonas phaseoli pv. manihotis]MBO9760277.1 hypothetical protein [Xanthomonas phaseoli pv. manihotis]MBO9765571.1 hypothetical protein [Xanthomonas phaseoli pv. manihotis]